MSDDAKPLTLEQVWAHANEGWNLANHRTTQWQAAERVLRAARAERDAAVGLLWDAVAFYQKKATPVTWSQLAVYLEQVMAHLASIAPPTPGVPTCARCGGSKQVPWEHHPEHGFTTSKPCPACTTGVPVGPTAGKQCSACSRSDHPNCTGWCFCALGPCDDRCVKCRAVPATYSCAGGHAFCRPCARGGPCPVCVPDPSARTPLGGTTQPRGPCSKDQRCVRPVAHIGECVGFPRPGETVDADGFVTLTPPAPPTPEACARSATAPEFCIVHHSYNCAP